MPKSLREVLAELDVQVRGLGQVDEANKAVDRWRDLARGGASDTEKLRVKQQEYYELAGKLRNRIRKLQRAEGDHSERIGQLRVAMARAKDAAKDYGRQAEKLNAELDEGRQVVGSGGGGGFVGSLGKAAGALTALAASVAGAIAGVRGLADSLRETIELGTELDTTARALGVTTQALQEWQFIAERANLDQDDMRQGFTDLAAAARDNDEAFRKLGISARDGSGKLKSMDQLMTEVLMGLHGTENATERMGIAMRLLGEDTGSAFVALSDLAPQLDDIRGRVRELGGGMSDETVEGASGAADAMQEFRLALRSLKSVLSAEVLPAITRIVRGLADVIGPVSEFLRNSSALQVALGGLAAAFGLVALAMLPVVAPLLVFVAIMAGLFLVVEDVVTAFRGGDSVFGSFVESMLQSIGITTTFQGALEMLGVKWEELKSVALGAIASMLEAIDSLPGVLKGGIFGDVGATAADVRAMASSAGDRASSLSKQLRANETARFQERRSVQKRRADEARQTVIEQLDARSEVKIEGATDPDAVRRVVREENDRRLRQLAGVIPEAAGG